MTGIIAAARVRNRRLADARYVLSRRHGDPLQIAGSASQAGAVGSVIIV